MKNILLLCLGLSLGVAGNAQGIDFFKGDWQAALDLAKSQDKLIFVDAYATWCGPCKRMAADVFPDAEVGAFYNRNFVSLKIDMEAPENEEFRNKYPVAAFPTLYYISPDGEVVQSVKGAQKTTQFIDTGKKALALAEPSGDYAEQYADGDRDPELVYKYVRSLIRNGESHLKVANDFLREQADLNTPENLQFIMLAATEADSRIFTMMVERKKEIIAANSEDLFLSQVVSACQTTAEKAIEYSSPELLAEAWAKMEAYYPEKAEKFQYTTEMDYALAHRDGKTYAKAARGYAKDIIAGDAAKLDDFALKVSNAFPEEEKSLEVAKYAAEEAIALDEESFRYHYTLATIERRLGNYKQAIASARTALELATEKTPGAVRMLNTFIETVEREM